MCCRSDWSFAAVGGKFSATIARLIEMLVRAAQKFFDLRKTSANLLGFGLQQAVARFAGIALRIEFD